MTINKAQIGMIDDTVSSINVLSLNPSSFSLEGGLFMRCGHGNKAILPGLLSATEHEVVRCTGIQFTKLA